MWLVTDTNIVEEILELKQNISFFYLRYRRKMTVFVRLLRFTHYHSILQFISVGAQITATHYDVVQYHPYDIIHN